MIRIQIVVLVFILLTTSYSIFNPRKKAKVIIISGQSNATDKAWKMYLSQEEQQKYTRVFDSIFINTWNSFLENNAEFFTPVTFCQGKQTHWFIRCMSKEFGDEKFYIIKYTYSSKGVSEGPFDPSNSGSAFSELFLYIDGSLKELKQMNNKPD